MKSRYLLALALLAPVSSLGDLPLLRHSPFAGLSVSVAHAQNVDEDAAAEPDAAVADDNADDSPVPDPEPIDGVGNNVNHPQWGAANTDLLRLAKVGYADGIDAPSLPNNQSARLISNLLNSQSYPAVPSEDLATIDFNSVADFGYAFGQFMDHDMDLTLDGGAEFDIPVAANDPIGPSPIAFTRSQTDPNSSPKQQINSVTSYLDLSQVYGSNETVANGLRTLNGGQLKVSPGNMLPFNNSDYFTADQITAMNMANDAMAVPANQLFAAGDRRANENIELTALEILFVRNHNRLAAILANNHPDWSDEDIYQEARKLNIAQYQNIIYTQWVPAIYGETALPPYNGYNPNTDAAIANEFSTVAFRFGHSLVSPEIERDGNDGQELTEGISLAFDFFDPNLLNPAGITDPLTGLLSTDIGPILKGDADGNGQAMDLLSISDVRNLLFGNGGEGGDDLIARDVQRGRDNGIPDYNSLRAAVGLPPITSFAQLTVDPHNPKVPPTAHDLAVQKAFAKAYPGGVNTIDAFEGGSAEKPLPDSEVGPLFQSIMVNQFRRLRDGDRFFYLNQSTTPEENQFFAQGNTLAKVIMLNTNVTNLQADVMHFSASISGFCAIQAGTRAGGPNTPSNGLLVQLRDSAGNVLATTHTDPHGHYLFDESSGPAANPALSPGVTATGSYNVTVAVPQGFTQLNPNPPAIEISRGDTDITNVNFVLIATPPAPSRVTNPTNPARPNPARPDPAPAPRPVPTTR